MSCLLKHYIYVYINDLLSYCGVNKTFKVNEMFIHSLIYKICNFDFFVAFSIRSKFPGNWHFCLNVYWIHYIQVPFLFFCDFVTVKLKFSCDNQKGQIQRGRKQRILSGKVILEKLCQSKKGVLLFFVFFLNMQKQVND